MLKIKTAYEDFGDNNIKQLLNYIGDKQYEFEQNIQVIQYKLKIIAGIQKKINAFRDSPKGVIELSLENINSDTDLVRDIHNVLGEELSRVLLNP